MMVHIKVFPSVGLCDETQKLEVTLEEGSMSELQTLLQKRLGITLQKMESLMFLHNGRALDKYKDIVFRDGDELWLLPLLSGG